MASNEARKKAAKRYQQAHPGTPYPEALRIVSHKTNPRPLGAVIGIDGEGHSVRLNLEEPAAGGDGPHCGIAGMTGTGKSNLLAVMATSILESAPDRGAQIVYSSDYTAPAFPHTAVAPAALDEYLTELLHGRHEVLRMLDARDVRSLVDRRSGDAPPAVVAMLDDPRWTWDAVPRALLRTLQSGRSLGVHVVLAWQDTRALAYRLEPYLTSRIDVSRVSLGLAQWRRQDGSAPNGIAVTEFHVPLASAISGPADRPDDPPSVASQE